MEQGRYDVDIIDSYDSEFLNRKLCTFIEGSETPPIHNEAEAVA